MGKCSTTENNKAQRTSKAACLAFTIFCIVVPFTIICTVFILQHRAIAELTRRVDHLEIALWEPKINSLQNVFRQNTQKEHKFEQEYLQVFEKIATEQMRALEIQCKNSSVTCLRGMKGDPGPKGDTGPKGERGRRGIPGIVRSSGHLRYSRQADQCCTSLSKPNINGPSTDTITIQQGQNALLPCHASASPPADVIWVPGRDPLNSGRYVETVDGLEVSSAKFVDTQLFECRASNVFGTTIKHVKLNVIDHLSVDLTPEKSTITSGTDPYLDYICTYKGVPPPTVSWYHIRPDNVWENITSKAQSSQGRSTLHIDNPTALDGGQYICEVKNAFEQLTDAGNVTVHSKPEIVTGPKTQVVTLGETITLHCDTVGSPKPSIQWYFPKTGTSVPKDVSLNPDGSITVNHVDKFSEGQYQCQATNSFGTSTSNGTVTVLAFRVVISFSGHGLQPFSLIDKNNFNNENKGVCVEDMVGYTCTYYSNILYVPLTVLTTPEEKPVQTGESVVQIACSGTGNPPPTLSWYKDKDPLALSANPSKYIILQNGALIITNFDQDKDTGVYTCNGTNGKNHDSDTSVLYKDLGMLDCDTTFSSCSQTIGTACGGRCPANCNSGMIFGYQVYSTPSKVCLAGRHAGVVRQDDDLIIWTIEKGGDTFESKLSNSVLSQFSGPLALQAHIYYKQIHLNALSTVSPIAPLGR